MNSFIKSRKNILLSFRTAWQGMKMVLVQEPSFKYMLLLAAITIGAMFYFPTSRTEKAVLLAMIFSVLILELINSAMERFLDFLQPVFMYLVRKVRLLVFMCFM